MDLVKYFSKNFGQRLAINEPEDSFDAHIWKVFEKDLEGWTWKINNTPLHNGHYGKLRKGHYDYQFTTEIKVREK